MRAIFRRDNRIDYCPKAEQIQKDIDLQAQARRESIFRAGDQFTEHQPHWHGIAPAGFLNKDNENGVEA